VVWGKPASQAAAPCTKEWRSRQGGSVSLQYLLDDEYKQKMYIQLTDAFDTPLDLKETKQKQMINWKQKQIINWRNKIIQSWKKSNYNLNEIIV